MELLRASLQFLPRTAIVAEGRSYRYGDLVSTALAAAKKLDASVQAAKPQAGCGPRVALMCDPGGGYAAATFASWLHGGVAVPLCLSHPDKQLQYVLEDAQVAAVLASDRHAERLHHLSQPFGARVEVVPEPPPAGTSGEELATEVHSRLAGQGPSNGALIIYTSGTTGRPKGALHTHASLAAMTGTLCAAWEWSAADRILHALPLHHVHGIVNALYCPLAVGATVEMLPKFSTDEAWRRLQREQDPLTVFMGVPTMYSYLLARYDDMEEEAQAAAAAAARRLRLTISGSAACPAPIMQRWEQLSGQRLLERYGMTETGMLLGNPLRGERRPGAVGRPFEGVQARIVDGEGRDGGAGPGELRVRSPQLFKEYWRRPEATAEAFDEQGYFMTGDTAVLEDGYYRLLGRTSVDIIKHGGYKISALAVESALLEHPDIAEAAVLGLPDEALGERITAVVALKPPAGGLTLAALQEWTAQQLPRYQLPTQLIIVPQLKRNAMGKVNKKELRQELLSGGGDSTTGSQADPAAASPAAAA